MKIDARGEACPLPLVKAKKALEGMESGLLEIWVDNDFAVRNLKKMAEHMGLTVTDVRKGESDFQVLIQKGDGDLPVVPDYTAKEDCSRLYGRETVVVISSKRMGEGDDVLGAVLLRGFLFAQTKLQNPPKTILFYNSGAELTTEGSESIEDLKFLEESGTEILTCGTCLNHYGLGEKLLVGGVTNMYEIAEKMAAADLIIRP